MSLAGFNPADVDPIGDREPIPEGEYEVMIVQTEWRDNSNSNGRHLKLTLEVLEGPHTGRLLWENLNLENDNQKTVEYAHRAVSSICRAVGFTGVLKSDDGEELCNSPMRVKVGIDPPRNGYKASNRIRKWIESSGKSASAPESATKKSGRAKPPWEK